MSRPDGLLYTATHEWVRFEGDLAVVGITAHAIEQLGDLAFVDLPVVGKRLAKGRAFGEIESTKAASELFAPLSGEVVEVHEDLAENLHRLSESPFDGGWLIKVRPSDPSERDRLLDRGAYEELLAQEEH